MKATRLYFVRCEADGSWLTTRKPTPPARGHIFAHNPSDPMLVSGPIAEEEWTAPYTLVPTPFTVENWPRIIATDLDDLIARAKRVIEAGDSYDDEHDTLVALYETLTGMDAPEPKEPDTFSHTDGDDRATREGA